MQRSPRLLLQSQAFWRLLQPNATAGGTSAASGSSSAAWLLDSRPLSRASLVTNWCQVRQQPYSASSGDGGGSKDPVSWRTWIDRRLSDVQETPAEQPDAATPAPGQQQEQAPPAQQAAPEAPQAAPASSSTSTGSALHGDTSIDAQAAREATAASVTPPVPAATAERAQQQQQQRQQLESAQYAASLDSIPDLSAPVTGYAELGRASSGTAAYDVQLQRPPGAEVSVANAAIFEAPRLHPRRMFFPGQLYTPQELIEGGGEGDEAKTIFGNERRTSGQMTSFEPPRASEVEQLADFKNLPFLNRFVTDAGNLVPRRRSRLRQKLHRFACRQVQVARNMALLPHGGGRLPEFQVGRVGQRLGGNLLDTLGVEAHAGIGDPRSSFGSAPSGQTPTWRRPAAEGEDQRAAGGGSPAGVKPATAGRPGQAGGNSGAAGGSARSRRPAAGSGRAGSKPGRWHKR